MQKNLVKIILSLSIGLFFFWVAFRGVNTDALLRQLKEVRLLPFLISTILFALHHFIKFWRWAIMIRSQADISTHRIINVCAVGFMAVVLMPLRLGEFVRPYLIAEKDKIRISTAMGTVVVERVVDGLLVTLSLFAFLFSLDDRQVPKSIYYSAFMALTVFISAMGVLILFLLRPTWANRLFYRILSPLSLKLADKITGLINSFIHGLKSFKGKKDLAAYLGLTLLLWTFNGLNLYALFFALNIDLPLIAGFICLCFIVVLIMIPAGPGFAGNFELAIISALTIFAVNKSSAMAFALLAHAQQLAIVIIMGCVPFLMGRITWGDVVKPKSGKTQRR